VSTLDLFSPATTAWFTSAFDAPTPAQTLGWASIASGRHTLIHAPTGSGKTLAAFLWSIDRLMTSPAPPPTERCRVLYVSPLKALAYDVDRNLRAPLTGIGVEASRLGAGTVGMTVGMRTGDTSAKERQAMLRTPPDLLITTPESLYLMLTSRARNVLSSIDTVIIDEVHAIAGTKRGAHLSLSLERLEALCRTPPQRIGLSATQRPLETISAFLGGGASDGERWTPRPVDIVDAPRDRELDIEIVVPVTDMTNPSADLSSADSDLVNRSIWPAMYPRLLELVREHRSTILFVNSRGLAERVAAEINRLADEELVQAHHGSVSREKRLDIEDRLKRGDLRAVVATSTLELGIDMAAVDLVVLVESPTSVARGLQRVGRSGHSIGQRSVAKVFPKHRGDLLETAVVVERMYAGAIEETIVPRNPIDVLAQQLVAMAAMDDLDIEETHALVRRAMPFQDLTRATFESVLDMLTGRYPSDDFAELRPRLNWDRSTGTVTARSSARLLAVTNPGTIPDRGLYTVHLPEGGRVGELDEEMVYESRPGDVFILGSTSWRIQDIDHDRVVVTPAPGSPAAKMPFWHGDAPGRPVELGRAVGAFTRTIGALEPAEARNHLVAEYRLDDLAAGNLVAFIGDEKSATGVLPTDRTIVVERFRDEIGDWRIVVLSPFGGRVHAPWALAIRSLYRQRSGGAVDVLWSDDGIVLRFPDVDTPPDTMIIHVDPTEAEEAVINEVGDTALFTSRFRESAARALLLPRRRPGTRTPLWLQRRKAANLLEVTRGFGSFPVMLETYREVLQDHFDVPALISLLTEIQRRTTRIIDVDTDGPSPFASSLMFDFVASFMYEYDAPVAERRATALMLDRSLLAELLGEPEFRELLDPTVIDEVEADLQHLSEDRRVRSADGLADLLRDLGPLGVDDIRARLVDRSDAEPWLDELAASGRVFRGNLDRSEVWLAAEDVARMRDSVGMQPPRGVPSDLLTPVEDPLGDVVGRYARTHGPFALEDAASGTGLGKATVLEILARLATEDKVRPGAYRPGGTQQEWVSTEVLRRLRRRSLAALRHQVEAVETNVYSSFLPSWHGIGAAQAIDLHDVLAKLAGAPVPASVFESDILAARNIDPSRSRGIDDLLSSGEVVWFGIESVGPRDGRIGIASRATSHILAPGPVEGPQDTTMHAGIMEHLDRHGASFFDEIYATTGGGDPMDLADALWDLVWSRHVTNDSLAPLRAFTSRRQRRPRRPTLVTVPPHGSGRWYLTSRLRLAEATPEERALAISHMLLDRHGIVTRDAVMGEGIPGGFTGIYRALSSLEDIGSVRRGYFVEGMGGAQFATPGAIERLRIGDRFTDTVIASTDPANAYGASVPWPDTEGRPERRAGASIAWVDGSLVAWMDPSGRSVATFGDAEDPISAGIEMLARRHGKASISRIDGNEAAVHRFATKLVEHGFTAGYKGFTVRPVAREERRSP
jgi:ATP-dependent helicase Lhr and Lhr-like helicase